MSPHDGLNETERDLAEIVGELMQFWGFKRPMGRIWTVLYLSAEPLGVVELADQLKMSAGSVSQALAELTRWGAVKKTWRAGERRDFYEAETSIYKLVLRVLRERELVLVREVGARLTRAVESLVGNAGQAENERLDFKRERVRRLCELALAGERLLSALVAGESVDPAPIRHAGARP